MRAAQACDFAQLERSRDSRASGYDDRVTHSPFAGDFNRGGRVTFKRLNYPGSEHMNSVTVQARLGFDINAFRLADIPVTAVAG